MNYRSSKCFFFLHISVSLLFSIGRFVLHEADDFGLGFDELLAEVAVFFLQF